MSVDAEDGFSDDPDEVGEFARQLAAVGAVGINLEDTLGPAGRHAAKIAPQSGRRLPACSSTPVRTRTGSGTSAVTERAASPRRCGASTPTGRRARTASSSPASTDPGRIAALVAHFDVPLNILYSPTGPSLPHLADLGVGRVSLGSLLYRRALGAALETAADVGAGREVGRGTGVRRGAGADRGARGPRIGSGHVERVSSRTGSDGRPTADGQPTGHQGGPYGPPPGATPPGAHPASPAPGTQGGFGAPGGYAAPGGPGGQAGYAAPAGYGAPGSYGAPGGYGAPARTAALPVGTRAPRTPTPPCRRRPCRACARRADPDLGDGGAGDAGRGHLGSRCRRGGRGPALRHEPDGMGPVRPRLQVRHGRQRGVRVASIVLASVQIVMSLGGIAQGTGAEGSR